MKNILVLTGSPRKEGNSILLANAFIEGAKAAGHTIMLFETNKMKINGCAACRKCFTTGKACSFDDDFDILAPMLERADIVVFCTPLYWFTFPAPLKAAIDKLYAYTIGKKDLKGKEAILMVCAGLDDEAYFDGILKSYEFILQYLCWQNKEILTVKKVVKRGDIKNTNALEKAKNIGLHIL